MLPKYLTEPDWKTRKDKSKKQENRIAKQTGGRTIAGSGSGRTKGDVNTKFFKIEAKRTDKESISLRKDWLRKISSEALSEGKRPALLFEVDGEEWAIILKMDFINYGGYLSEEAS